MDKEPWRNKNTGKNFNYFFHIQMPKETRYEKMGLSRNAKACFAY